MNTLARVASVLFTLALVASVSAQNPIQWSGNARSSIERARELSLPLMFWVDQRSDNLDEDDLLHMFRDDVVDERRRHAAGHGGDACPLAREAHRAAGRERRVQRRAADRLDADDARFRVACMDDGGEAGDQPAAADGDQINIRLGNGAQHFERHGALADDDVGILERVEIGGALALRIGLGNAEAFGAIGSLQAAIGEDQVADYTDLVKSARAKNAKFDLRLLTSKDDYFKAAIRATSVAWRAAGIEHEMVEIPGPHDYPFNRGPGAIEMLLWHDRRLARG